MKVFVLRPVFLMQFAGVQEDFNVEKNPEMTADSFLNTMAQMTVLVTRLMVEFAKSLPGFIELSMDDQIILLKVRNFLSICS